MEGSRARELAFDVCIERIVVLILAALQLYDVKTEKVLILDSSGPAERGDSYKCSRHVHFPEAWFRTNFQDMPRFLKKHVVADAERILLRANFAGTWDMSVYTRMRPFRMLGCHKRASKRVLKARVQGDNREQFFAGLVQPSVPPTHIAIGEAPKVQTACDSDIDLGAILQWFRSKKMSRQPKCGVEGCTCETCDLGGDPAVYSHSPCSAQSLASGLCYRLNSTSKFCTALGRAHGHNNIYYLLNLEKSNIRQCCYTGASCRSQDVHYTAYKECTLPKELAVLQSNDNFKTVINLLQLKYA
jgi:hypothetical protein